eukprot:CAMPEP_0119027982 /NCGR_PEP_ID=MMETSP1176-20130426/38074_1 /TAXON_ID=265551 /ORGANISM="Synedropsis recta cf, Strain CCMP1620" /LENGTH=98 /DNA_ID=CAMNT_0006984017 /DNA_START=239 /DNA_END=532 /DNA_ORIENTATION=+
MRLLPLIHVALSLGPASAFLSPLLSKIQSRPLFSADPEEAIEEEFLYAPEEPFTSEADTAAQANLLAGNGQIELQTEIEQSFLQYALSIILGRALPDA